MKFFNRRYFTRQVFEIQKSSLKIERKNLFDAIEYETPLDLISNKMKIQTVMNSNLVMVGLFFMVFSFIFLFGATTELTGIFFCIGFLFVALSFVNRKKVVTITALGEHNIELYFGNRNKHEVVEYAHSIIKAADNYLLNKFSKVDRLLPIEPQLENYKYLLDREIISEEKFEILKNQLLGNDNKSLIGFGQK